MGLRRTTWKRRRCATSPDRQQAFVLHSFLKTSHAVTLHPDISILGWQDWSCQGAEEGKVLSCLGQKPPESAERCRTNWLNTAAKVLPLVHLVKDRKRWRKRFLSNFSIWVCNGLASLLYFRPTMKFFNKAVRTVPCLSAPWGLKALLEKTNNRTAVNVCLSHTFLCFALFSLLLNRSSIRACYCLLDRI